jgi:hypothetical protein
MAENMIDQYLNMGSRVQYGLNLLEGSTVLIDESGANVTVATQVYLDTLIASSLQRILTIDANISTNLQVLYIVLLL